MVDNSPVGRLAAGLTFGLLVLYPKQRQHDSVILLK